MKRGQVKSIEQGKPAVKQHRRPCGDCPWSRTSARGWLGGVAAKEWLGEAHGETRIDCHTKIGPQCAGAAIYRTNVRKSPRDRSLLVLPEDAENVFDSPRSFLEHHEVKP